MFDIDSGKLIILGVIALIVIKPKDLPGVMRQIGNTMGQLRRMAAEFQGQFKDAIREAELDELKKDMAKVTDFNGLDPFADVKNDIEKTKSEIESSFQTPAHTPAIENTFAESIEPATLPSAPAQPGSQAETPVASVESSSAPPRAPEPGPARSGMAT